MQRGSSQRAQSAERAFGAGRKIHGTNGINTSPVCYKVTGNAMRAEMSDYVTQVGIYMYFLVVHPEVKT